ncbi:MAG: hypothetical protein ACRD9L_01400 [Bryobacteraceae bacterium]
MQDLIIRDVRLVGPRPAGDEVLEVDERTPLSWPLAWVVDKSAKYGGDVRVRIMGHGAGPVLYSRQLPDVMFGANEEAAVSPGGCGMYFCAECLSLKTVDQFNRWRGKVKNIDLVGCAVAYITAGYEGKSGDGNFLCMKLAQTTQAYVKAATFAQPYDFRHMSFFRGWVGTVLTYGPSGAVVKVENSPPM